MYDDRFNAVVVGDPFDQAMIAAGHRPLVVITGTGRGLGGALVNEFSPHGWDVVAVQRSSVPSALSGPDLHVVQHDLRSPDVSAIVAAVGDRAVDVLINNAVSGAPPSGLADVDLDLFADSLAVNVIAPLRLTQALLPGLLAARDSTVVNITSRLGSLHAQADGRFAALSTSHAYKVSKAALNMLTISLAAELHNQVRCLAIHPGLLRTQTGNGNATTPPTVAAKQLRALLLTTPLPPSGTFVDLNTGGSMAW